MVRVGAGTLGHEPFRSGLSKVPDLRRLSGRQRLRAKELSAWLTTNDFGERVAKCKGTVMSESKLQGGRLLATASHITAMPGARGLPLPLSVIIKNVVTVR